MSNDRNISNLIKKKVLTFGSKPSSTKTVTSQVKAPKPKEVKPAKVKPRKAQQAPQQTQQQPQTQLSDFSLSTATSANNIIIITMYQGQGVHAFTLPSIEYDNWQRATFQQKYAYIFSRTDVTAFGNDIRIIQAVIRKTIQILDTVFVRAWARKLRQSH